MAQTIFYCIREACKQLSLLPPSDIFGSQDETALLMGSVANNAGILLNGLYPWQVQGAKMSFTGDGIRKEFDLPPDFDRFIDNTGWATVDQSPVVPTNSQNWAELAAYDPIDNGLQCRLFGGKLEFITPLSDGEIVRFEYIRKTWVFDADDLTVRKEVCDKNGDVPAFDWMMMLLAIKVKWREAKGFDITAAMGDLMDRIQQAQNQGTIAPILYIGGGGSGFRFIGDANIPDGGFGGP